MPALRLIGSFVASESVEVIDKLLEKGLITTLIEKINSKNMSTS